MLISDKQFIALTEIAKKIAYSITGENLSTDHYLCALRVASKNISFNEILGEISSWEVVSDAAAKRLNFDINKSLVDGSAPQLKLSDSFREILSSLKNNSFKEFITALVSKESDGRPSIVKDAAVVLSAENDAHFDAIYGFADVLAQAHNLSTIDLDTFVIGAWAATKAGVLKDRPSIVNNLHANADAIQYLMKCRGWKLPKDKSPNLSRTISQGGDLVEALKSSGKQSNSLLAIVNQGVKLGMDIMTLERTAFHEAGHAVVNLVVLPQLDIREVSVDSDNPGEGLTSFETNSSWMLTPTSKEDVENKLCVALAGRVAEQKKAGHTSGMDAGASQDLDDATRMAWNAIAVWGMDEEMGAISLEALASASKSREGWLFDLAQQRIQILMKRAYARTEEIVSGHWSEIEIVAGALMKNKKLSADDLLRLIPKLIR